MARRRERANNRLERYTGSAMLHRRGSGGAFGGVSEMWNQFGFLNRDLRTEAKTKLKRLLISWAIFSFLVLLLFAGFWFWHGAPLGPDGTLKTCVEMIVMSVLAPPVVWLIGKAIIG